MLNRRYIRSQKEEVKNKSTVIYLAGETEEKAVKCFREVMQVVDPMLDEIRARSYGNALRELGIFAVIIMIQRRRPRPFARTSEG